MRELEMKTPCWMLKLITFLTGGHCKKKRTEKQITKPDVAL